MQTVVTYATLGAAIFDVLYIIHCWKSHPERDELVREALLLLTVPTCTVTKLFQGVSGSERVFFVGTFWFIHVLVAINLLLCRRCGSLKSNP